MFYKPAKELNCDLRFQIGRLLLGTVHFVAGDRRAVTDVLSEIREEFAASKLQMLEAADGFF